MPKKPKEQKHAVAAPTEQKKPEPRKMTVWSEYHKEHQQMSLEAAVRESIKNWNAPSWAVSTQWFDEPGITGSVNATMKSCGYYPVLVNGKQVAVNGVYNFEYRPA
jgi:hypothetical protein